MLFIVNAVDLPIVDNKEGDMNASTAVLQSVEFSNKLDIGLMHGHGSNEPEKTEILCRKKSNEHKRFL